MRDEHPEAPSEQLLLEFQEETRAEERLFRSGSCVAAGAATPQTPPLILRTQEQLSHTPAVTQSRGNQRLGHRDT
ncbi:hypothetical protein FQA47_008558 [Oryzias melastigma]|uniref:Uncharacterized protein n=1 Tax=Oryzias melastigma TaxID=30732 RepID=A0A834EVQ6_ORYME|nr:hypothetical protein FQA47_008558 [Oryzias melastigma]